MGLHHRKWMAWGALDSSWSVRSAINSRSAAANSCPRPTTARWPSRSARRRAPALNMRATRSKRPPNSRVPMPEMKHTDSSRQCHRRPRLGRCWREGDRSTLARELGRGSARQTQAARGRGVRGVRRSRTRACASRCRSSSMARTRGSSWRSPTSSWRKSGRFQAPWTWVCRSRIPRMSCESRSTAALPTSSAFR